MALNLTAAPVGKQTLSVNFGGTTLQTYTYRPAGEIKGVLLNFHGRGGNGEGIRDYAIDFADQKGLYVVAPVFDTDRFSSSEYQMGGIVSGGRLLSQEDWTVSIANDIADWAHAKVGNDPDDETILFGHSAGAQFLSRVAAFGDDATFDKMIIANPSTHVRASLTENVAYGFDGYFSAAKEEAMLKDYLADPVTIYLGSEDDDPNAADLSKSAATMRQGEDRLERGRFVYNEAKKMAESNGWAFNWELVIADGVGHAAGSMLRAPEMNQAFNGRASGTRGSATPELSGTTKSDTSRNDSLTGTDGNDGFVFDTAPNATNVNTIMDFNVDDDRLHLDDAIFGQLSAGTLKSSQFRIGAEALDSDDYIIYNQNTGDVYYDRDGSGSAAAAKLAVIDNKALLTHTNFIVF
jgi:pimeloyl-ACP methyl ester carboxylesterase